jgi:hypothetical protein
MPDFSRSCEVDLTSVIGWSVGAVLTGVPEDPGTFWTISSA